MLYFLRERITSRKSRMFGVACCRRFWGNLTDEDFWQCVRLAERFADGGSTEREVSDVMDQLIETGGERWLSDWAAAMIGILDPVVHPTVPADSACQFAKRPLGRDEAALVRDIFGNPFRPAALDPAWRTETVVALARGIYEERAFDRMPILADALQDAGCTSEDVLGLCRDAKQVHVRGCWVVDLVLGKS